MSKRLKHETCGVTLFTAPLKLLVSFDSKFEKWAIILTFGPPAELLNLDFLLVF